MKVTVRKKLADGREIVKHTYSYEIHLNVELSENEFCNGCPALAHTYAKSTQCGILQISLQRNDRGWSKRHPRCPLQKTKKERMPTPAPCGVPPT
jgi:hypothetical protein